VLILFAFFFSGDICVSFSTGKVGVTGSGKGTTDYVQRKKHEFDQTE